MIQDIAPSVFNNEYKPHAPNEDDYVFIFDGRTILCRTEDNRIICPKVKEIGDIKLQFLFAINENSDYLYMGEEIIQIEGYSYENVSILRRIQPKLLCFAGMTAFHLYTWYINNRFCGRCGRKTIIYDKERAMKCPDCGNIIYPRISPAVIVGITNGDKIVMTRYAGREYKGRSLVAGFCEIGETAEDTVRREVMEEVGLKVKNVRYYKSQPWGFDGGLLMGFYCDLDGSDVIKLEEDELAIAEWVDRKDIVDERKYLSLTEEMIMNFRDGKERP